MERLKVVLVGAGNLATNLGKALFRAGHEIVQVYSRTAASATALAETLNCAYTTELHEVVRSADVFIISVKDSALASVATALQEGRERQLFVHTAGSMPMDTLPLTRRAVFCCNFANHCFSLGAELLERHGHIPFSVMLPLIDETAAKLYSMSPRAAQTGPAVRWDTNVMDAHLQLLADSPEMQQIYELMSKSIHHD